MDKVYLTAVLAILAGCAVTPPERPAAVAAPDDAGTLQAALIQPSAVLEIADFTSKTVCKPVTPTGTRMSRGEMCTTTDIDPNMAELQRLQRERTIDDINRRSSAEIARRQREDMRSAFPMARF